MIKNYFAYIALVVFLVGAAFCYMWSEGGTPGQSSLSALTSKTWTWETALYNDGREVIPKQEGAFTLAFSDGRFSGTTDCNSLSGGYVLSPDGTFAFTEIAMTKKYCEGSQDTEFAMLLEHTSGYHISSDGRLILDLKFDSGSVVFR